MKLCSVWWRVMVCLFILMLLPGLALAGSSQTDAFRVTTIWVMREANISEAELIYSYEFAEAAGADKYSLDLSPASLRDEHASPRILRVSGDIQLPKKNTAGQAATYALSMLEAQRVQRGEFYFAVSSAESALPADQASYVHRFRIMNQQINPIVQLNYEGEEALNLTLTLHMTSWAVGEGGSPLAHSATRQVEVAQAGELNLFELFGDNLAEVVALRDFTAVELL